MDDDTIPVLVVHGGAGTLRREWMTEEKRLAYLQGIEASLLSGYEVLIDGGSALDATEAAVVSLEDCPLFNAGKGAVYSNSGLHEHDALIVDGRDRSAGGVTAVLGVRNPIKLARKVMTDSRHILLAADGAAAFAKQHGLQMEDEDYFHTEHRRQAWQAALAKDQVVVDHTGQTQLDQQAATNSDKAVGADGGALGTVGAVAVDKHGNLASATSTGGLTNKAHGRVGDTPLMGCGGFADNATCAVSCTGQGETIIQALAAYDVHALMQYRGLELLPAARMVVHDHMTTFGGGSGLIAVDHKGNVAMPFHSSGMYRGWIRNNIVEMGIFRGETPTVE